VKPNYQYEKRQRDLRKLQKKEEKRLRKLALSETPEVAPGGPADGPQASRAESEVKS